MNYDLLLSWISERGEGSLTSFRRAHDWLATNTEADLPRWTWTLQSLQSLGHVEVDWSRRRWAAAPPTIATMVGGGGYAYLCGARTQWFMRRIENLEQDAEIGYLADNVLLENPVTQLSGPSLQLLTLASDDEIATLCEALGVRYAPCAADTLLALLPPLSAMLQIGRRDELPGGVFPTRMGDSTPESHCSTRSSSPQTLHPAPTASRCLTCHASSISIERARYSRQATARWCMPS